MILQAAKENLSKQELGVFDKIQNFLVGSKQRRQESDKIRALLQAVDKLEYDCNATRHVDVFSGGFLWSDEVNADLVSSFRDLENYFFRYVIGYRGSLIRSRPDTSLKQDWDFLKEHCPGWPGFHPDRCSTKLSQELENALEREFDRDMKEFGKYGF